MKLRCAWCAGAFALASVLAATCQAAKPNQAPSVTLTSPANGAVFTAGATIPLAATAADSDGTIAKVEFLRGGGTLIGTATAAPYGVQWTNVPPGSYSLTAKATDNLGATKVSAAVAITVNQPANQSPTVTISSPANGAAFTAPATIAIAATASDADGSIARVDFLQGGNLIGSSTSAPYGVTWSNVAAGSYALTAKATDNAGAVTTSSPVNVTVGPPNLAPLVVLTAPLACTSYDAPASIVLAADAVDVDGAIAKVDFLAGASILGTSVVAPYSIVWTNVAPGRYSVVARATDQRGGIATSTPVTVVVRNPNQPPAVALTSPRDGAVFNAPAAVALSASATDPDGTISKVEFLCDGAVIGSAVGAPYQASWASPPTGPHTIVARATDNLGATADSASVHVTVNGPPAVQITSPADGASFVAPADIAVAIQASAMAGPITRLEVLDNGVAVGALTPNATPVASTFLYSSVGAGVHVLTVRATDSAGLVTTSSGTRITVNALPLVALTAPTSGARFGAPAAIDLVADASVGFGAIAKVDFFAGGNLVGTSSAPPYGVTWAAVPAGAYTLTARATTTAGLSSTSPPVSVTVNSVSITIDSPVEGSIEYGDDVVVTGSFSAVQVSQVTVNGIGARIGTRSFAAAVPLQPGANALAMVADTSLGRVTRTVNVVRREPAAAITSVVNGQTIFDDTVTIVGTAQVPSHAAIALNGQLATLAADGTFFIDNFPLDEGENPITVSVNTPAIAAQLASARIRGSRIATGKALADATLTLNRSGIAPFTVTLDKTSGLAPLTVDVLLDNRLAYVYDRLTLDIDGNGTVDYAEDGLDVPILEREFQVTYDTPGIYPLTLTLTRQGGAEIIYRAVRMVHVQSAAQAADDLRAVFTGMLDRLAAGDATGAAHWFTGTVRERYQKAFGLLASVLPMTVEGIGTVENVTLGSDHAELSVVRDTGGSLKRFVVLLIRDEDGLWRIDGM